MKEIKITGELNNLLILDKKYLKLLESNANNLNANIKYWLKKGTLTSLKNGKYILTSRYEQEINKDMYLEYLAGELLIPSYISLEYVLAKYQILSEPVRAITSLSTKQERVFINKLGTWRYYTIPKRLFLGYKLKNFKGMSFYEASLAKALFDFLYLRLRRSKSLDISKLRLNLENLKPKDWQELDKYFKLMPGEKWQKLNKELKKYA